MLQIVSKALLLCFCLSGARERMNPFKPLTVLVPLPDSDKMMVHISWNHSSDGNWKLRYHMSMGEHGRPVPLSGSQMREFTARLERDFAVPRVLDPVSFNMKKRRWRKGWVQSGRCGSLEPYWDKSSKNLSMAIWDAYSVLEASDLPKTKVLVNVGAGDGPGAGQSVDPVWVLALGFQLDAVFVEPGSRDFEKLKQNIESHRMPLGLGSEPYQMALKPDDIPKLVRGSAVLQKNLHWLDVLKVDIDVNDCDVAASFLRERRARIVVIEVNPSFPPPIHFCQHATSPPHGNTKPLHGCSLSYMVELFAGFDLWLYRFDGQDGLFVDSFLAREMTEAFGEHFPKDEIDCFQWPQLLPSTASAPVDDFRNWFYDIAKAEEMLDVALKTAKAQYARERRLCTVGSEAKCKFHDVAAAGERAMVRAPPYKWLDAGSQVACKQACCDDTSCRAATFSGSGGDTCMLHKQVPLLPRSALPESGGDAIDVVHVRREARDEEACMEAFQVLQPHLPMTIGLPICGPSCQFPVWP